MGAGRATLRIARAARFLLRPAASTAIARPRAAFSFLGERNVETVARGWMSSGFYLQQQRHYTDDVEFQDAGDDLVVYDPRASRRAQGSGDALEDLWAKVDYSQDAVLGIKQWERSGNKLTRSMLAMLLQRMRCRRMHTKSVQILSWLVEKKPIEVTEGDYEQLVTLACRDSDYETAERYFYSLPSHLSKWPAFSALVAGYASRNLMAKAENLMRTGTSPLPQPYSAMILMYIRRAEYQKIVKIYKSMKADGIEPNVITYTVLLKFKDRIGPIKGLEQDVEDALGKIKLSEMCAAKRPAIAGNMMHCYAMLGKLDKVEEVWQQMDQERRLPEGFFVMAIESLALLGQVTKAEKVAQMKPTANVQARLLQALARHFAKQGNMKRVEEMLGRADRYELTPSFGIYNYLVTGYLARKDPQTAASRMRLALKVVTEERAVPSYAAVTGLLPYLAAEKDVTTAEQMVRRYRGWTDDNFHKLLLNVYVEAGKGPSPDIKSRFRRLPCVGHVEARRLAIRAFALEP
ncbi:pentatricopeptide repeat-containing protein At4g02820, mitochondrial-like [Selaginella moellendorffii]|uniref:pentatricopeptide repeat-containing protein At4g02820, mitochondrial-like n=1 Tax=Selaginella moellendorffii TaxID=88036 RepID=UPI000D1C7903|nr:pentatricopeptide repeat-containing protein At4g02820, mitochondrial-like [Selaginella moellendorffii]|eukprot:XP_024543396.1 pentatricopeptide repeat-containing protein At4g02820, mitochondrial-like [Selaginella moellendorffii]